MATVSSERRMVGSGVAQVQEVARRRVLRETSALDTATSLAPQPIDVACVREIVKRGGMSLELAMRTLCRVRFDALLSGLDAVGVTRDRFDFDAIRLSCERLLDLVGAAHRRAPRLKSRGPRQENGGASICFPTMRSHAICSTCRDAQVSFRMKVLP